MRTLEIYNQRFADSGQRVFARALDGARRRGQNYVVVEHLIEALAVEEGRFFQSLMSLLKIDPDQIQTLIAKRLESFPQQASGKLRLAPATIVLFKQAWEVARNDQRLKIESFDLILALAIDDRGLLIELLKGLNADVDAAAETIRALDCCTQILSRAIEGKKAESVTQIGRGGKVTIIKLHPPRTRLVKRRRD
jgi:ATP-dependent Clp protease ATP-binding subunit ClpA